MKIGQLIDFAKTGAGWKALKMAESDTLSAIHLCNRFAG